MCVEKGGFSQIVLHCPVTQILLEQMFVRTNRNCFCYCLNAFFLKAISCNDYFILIFSACFLFLSGARKVIHEMIFCSLLMETEYKRQFAMKFTEVCCILSWL